jgi:hypothetical protein
MMTEEVPMSPNPPRLAPPKRPAMPDPKDEVLTQVVKYLAEVRQMEHARNRAESADNVTNRHVLSAIQDLKSTVDTRFSALEHRVTGVEARVTLVENRKIVSSLRPPSMPPAYELGLQVSKTGSHYISPEGHIMTIEQAQKYMVENVIKEEHLKEDGHTLRWIKTNAWFVFFGVAVVVIAAWICFSLGLSVGHSGHPALPESHEGK